MNSRSSDNDCVAFVGFARSQFNRRLIAVSVTSPMTGGVRIDEFSQKCVSPDVRPVRFVRVRFVELLGHGMDGAILRGWTEQFCVDLFVTGINGFQAMW
jgi:hypothetical protein